MWTLSKSSDRQKPICLPDRSGGEPPLPAPKLPMKRRLMVLVAAIAVPAMAAPGDFGAIAGDAPSDGSGAPYIAYENVPVMPFETPGGSFPGSAFYYLADPPSEALVALPSTDPLDTSADGRELGELINVGPAASPFASFAGSASQSRAHTCLAQAIYYEAASESEAGQRAVAQVVLNRVAHTSWPASVCGVVFEGSQRSTGCQFSFTCDGSMRRTPSANGMARARRIASEALSGSVYAPIGHATHYHTLWVNPYWASSLDHVGTIGAHRFYKNRGSAGKKSAFTQSYAGYEPGVSASGPAPSAPNAAPRIEPAAVSAVPASRGGTRATFTPGRAANAAANAKPSTPDAALADQNLRGAGQVKAPYSNAGQWKDSAGAALAAQEAERLAAERMGISAEAIQTAPQTPGK